MGQVTTNGSIKQQGFNVWSQIVKDGNADTKIIIRKHTKHKLLVRTICTKQLRTVYLETEIKQA